MQNKAVVDEKIFDDAELIALVRQTQDELDAYGEMNALLRDFATELLKRRELAKRRQGAKQTV